MMNDQSVALSPGFRNILSMINGKRNGRALLEALPQLDEVDLGLWCEDLLRRGLIAVKGELLPEDAAFTLTTDMSLLASTISMDVGAEVNDMIAEVERSLEPPLTNTTRKRRLSASARAAAPKPASQDVALRQSRFFIFSDTAQSLPAESQVWIATHEAALAKLLALLIKSHGLTCRVFTTRQALSEQLRSAKQRPHTLILDTGMPEVDGFRALETIRTTPSLMGIRVVLISPRGDRVDLARAMMRGAAGHIVKPLKRDVMELAIRQLFGTATKPAP